jgi:hypothetical protein
MNKLFKIALLIATLNISVFAETNISASVSTKYASSYLVNNLVQANDALVAGVNLGKTYAGVDFSLSSDFIPVGSGSDSSHWSLGAGKSFEVLENASIRAEAGTTRHQTGQSLIQNYTEVNATVAFQNKFLVPYVKGIYNVELEQSGATVGISKPFSLFNFNFSPVAEYTVLTSSKTYAAKLGVSRNIYRNLDLFAEAAYIRNDFSTKNINFALKEENGLVGAAGFKLSF